MIDFHVHAFPDSLAARVIPQLAERAGVCPAYDGTVSGLQKSMRQSGVTYAVIQHIATKPGQVRAINQWCRELQDQYGLFSFGALHPDMADGEVEQQVEFLKNQGIRGVKLHPEYQNFYPDEDRLETLYSKLEAAGLALLIHAGIDLCFNQEPKAAPARILQINQAFPKLKLIAAHLGGFRMWDEVERCLIGRPVWLDTAYCADECPGPRILELARAHSVKRVLFGSDAPWGNQAAHREYLRQAGFTAEELSEIECGNACDMLGLERADFCKGG